MRADTLLALTIVALAIAFLVRRAVKSARAKKASGPGCDNCAH